MVEPGKLSEKSDRKIQTQIEYTNRLTGTKQTSRVRKRDTHM